MAIAAIWYMFILSTFSGQVYGTGITTVEFNDQNACLVAAKVLKEQQRRDITAWCVPR